ncbi:hypothetical protein ACFY9A_39865 [Streptomyces rubradiris]|uniref:hypothetical protein n=1 Tax=Streptomyces rubradiris TaxID=285531 RepID=UPI0036ED196D
MTRTACRASVERVLLTNDQAREHELPLAEEKAGDLRWPARRPAASWRVRARRAT